MWNIVTVFSFKCSVVKMQFKMSSSRIVEAQEIKKKKDESKLLRVQKNQIK